MVWQSLTKVQNSSESPKNMYAFLSLKWVPKFTFKFYFEKVKKSASLRPLFDQPWPMTKITRNFKKIGVHAYLLNGYLNLHSNLNSKILEKVHIFRPLFDQVLLRCKIARNPQKINTHTYLSNGYINPLSNFNFKKARKRASLLPWFNQPCLRPRID